MEPRLSLQKSGCQSTLACLLSIIMLEGCLCHIDSAEAVTILLCLSDMWQQHPSDSGKHAAGLDLIVKIMDGTDKHLGDIWAL